MKTKLERLKQLQTNNREQYDAIGQQLIGARINCSTTEVDQLIALTSALAMLRASQALEELVFIFGESDK